MKRKSTIAGATVVVIVGLIAGIRITGFWIINGQDDRLSNYN